MLEQAHTSPSDTIPASAGLEEEGGEEGVCYILYMYVSINSYPQDFAAYWK